DELADRLGPPPKEVDNLLYQLRIRVLAAKGHVSAISTEGGQFLLQIEKARRDKPPTGFGPDVRLSRRGLWMAREPADTWQERLERLLETLATAPEPARPQPR
ncbi:MAG: TRCF domain-containing protein, partial [Anaerolineales bacterium]